MTNYHSNRPPVEGCPLEEKPIRERAWTDKQIEAMRKDAERLEVAEDQLLTLVNAIKRAGGDPLKWSDWTPSEREAIDTAMQGATP